MNNFYSPDAVSQNESEGSEESNGPPETNMKSPNTQAPNQLMNPTADSPDKSVMKSLHAGDVLNGATFLKLQQLMDVDGMTVKRQVEEYNFYVHDKKYSFGVDSLFIFKESTQFRKYCVWLITWHWFDKIITIIILLNTISLAMQNYDFRVNGTENTSQLTLIRNQLEYFFTAVFLCEFLIKVIAMGFVLDNNTYLRDGWNVLDFAVVITSVLSLSGSINLSAIRTIRILRPLRSIKSIPGLRILVASLLDSLPNLGNVVIFLLYLMVIFGILGIQLFSGAYESRCRLTEFPVNGVWQVDNSTTHLCEDNSGCPENTYCGNPIAYGLPYQDHPIPELSDHYTTFDDILQATFTIFQALATEGWSSITYQLSYAVNTVLVYAYFIVLSLIGAFFTVNLVLAVINDSFLKNQQERKKEIFKEESTRKMLRKQKRLKEKQEAKVHPLNGLNVFQTESSDSDEEVKKKKQELIKSVLKPSVYLGRAEVLKQLQDQHNKKLKEEKHVNYFDPQLATVDKQTDNRRDIAKNFKILIKALIESNSFQIFVNVMIIANTIILSLDRYPQSASEQSTLDYLNQAFTVFFVFEMLLKLYGLGFNLYFKDTMNIFDIVIVVISVADQVMSYTSIQNSSLSVVTAFRTLRIFRIFKLARSWVSLREILIAIAATLEAISSFVILLLLFMVIASLIGMELFAYNVSGIRLNFDTFPEAMITIFVLLTQESWNTITYQYMLGMDSWWPMLFFVTIVIMGNFILLKLFIAILIYNFGQSAIEAEKKLEDKAQKNAMQRMMEQFKSSVRLTTNQNQQNEKEKEKDTKKKKKMNLNYFGNEGGSDVACFFLSKYDEARFEARKENKQRKVVQRFFLTAEVVNPDDISDDSSDDENLQLNVENKLQNKLYHNDSLESSKKSIFTSKTDSSTAIEIIESVILVGKSLYFFDPANKFRRVVFLFINKSQVVGFIIIMIIVSSVLLALEDPLTGTVNPVVTQIDFVVTIIFTLEATCKIIAQGFVINGENSYLRDVANILDFVVIVFSITNYFTEANLSIFKILRLFRVLRPLRLIARNDSLKIAINALILSVPKLANLLLVCLIFFLMFGIFGVNFFKGSFFYCDYRYQGDVEFDIVNKWDCMDIGGNWVNADYNFDNTMNAMQTLFVISTTEGWVDRMYQGIDAVGIDLEPVRFNAIHWSLFYIGFVIIGAFFVMNLFAGVVLDAFNSEKDKLRGYFFLTLEQQEWVDVRERVYLSKPIVNMRASQNKFRQMMFNLISHKYFDKTIFTLIIINTVIFMVQFARQPDELTVFITYANYVFLAFFTLEMLAKLTALGKIYFAEPFNRFDFVVVIMTLFGVLMEQLNLFTTVGTAISVLRSFRITRIMRLIRSARSLRIIFETFIVTLPQMAIIGGLLTIILFMYAVLGLNLYPYLKRNQGITADANFTTLLTSFFTLFKSSTGESWDVVLADTTRSTQPNNVCFSISTYTEYETLGFNGCGDYTGYLYFVSFQLLFTMIMLNLFVAVIVQGYDKIQRDEASLVTSNDIDSFQDYWKRYDPDATGLIKALDLESFLINLVKPLGWKNVLLTSHDKHKFISEFMLPVYIKNNCSYFMFYDVLEILGHGVLQRKFGDDTELEPQKQVKATRDLQKMRAKLVDKIQEAIISRYNSRDIMAAAVIMRMMKRSIRNKQIKQIRQVVDEDDDDDDAQQYPQESDQMSEGRPASSNQQTLGQFSVSGGRQMRNKLQL